jgi:L-amino acid N-acyltransferase YncA
MNVRQATEADAGKIADIYNWYVLNTIISFETDPVSPGEMKKRVRGKLDKYDWIVGESDQGIVGYAYYGLFRERAAYHHTVESTIYLPRESMGKGFGKALYSHLIRSAKGRGFREMIGIIALPNPESIALHQKIGFEEVGVLRGVGYKLGRYIDVGLWQRSLT